MYSYMTAALKEARTDAREGGIRIGAGLAARLRIIWRPAAWEGADS